MIHSTGKIELIEKLLANDIQTSQLCELRKVATSDDLSVIIQRIYDLNETHILKIAAVEGVVDKMNRIKNRNRNERFVRKMKKGFRDLENSNRLVVLAEGDSWFNYPIILSDIIDLISSDPDLAVYSVAAGGDWLLNMLSAREYVEELSVLHPNVFLISGGGNDLVGSRRLATIIEPKGGCHQYENNQWARGLIANANQKQGIELDNETFAKGCRFLSKDFFALLMFFHLQYYLLIDGILTGGRKAPKFDGIKIISHGYDFAIPSYNKGFGINPAKWYVPFIRSFFGHGEWLKTPMQLRGVLDAEIQRSIVYSMIYLFNEMMIEMSRDVFGKSPTLKGRLFHIDCRTCIGEKGWTDELHPISEHFMKIGRVFVDCIKERRAPTYDQVYVVSNLNM